MAYTTIDDPGAYFTAYLWTGDGVNGRALTGVGFQPNMMWSKVRTQGHEHSLVDTVRGVDGKRLMPNDDNNEDTTNSHGHFDSLDSDGFTLTTAGGDYNVNRNTDTYVGWFWKETADAGFDMVSHFFAPMFGFDGKYEINRMQGKDKFYKIGTTEFRPEFNFCNSDKKSSNEAKIIKEPKLQFNLTNDTLIEELVQNVELVCLISLFYYKLKIDYSFARIHLKDKTVTIKKILEPQINKISGSSSLWAVKYHNQFDIFLSLNWQNGAKKNFQKLKKVIPKFYQSTIVEGSSSFLLLYNIIEVCKGGNKKDNGKFTTILEGDELNTKYDEALKILLETVDEKDYVDFKKKWKNIKDKLEFKPMKSDIEEFLRGQNLNPDDFSIKVDKLVQIRSDLTHGSINRVSALNLEDANILLYRLSVILILNLLGLNDIWKFEKEIKEGN